MRESVKFHFVIPTYERPQLIELCLSSIYDHVPTDHLGMIVVINQSDYPVQGAIELRMRPGWPGIRRRVGAQFILDHHVPLDDIFIFLDDDIQLTESFVEHHKELLRLALDKNTGCIQLAWRKSSSKKKIIPIKLGFTGGGIVVQIAKYLAFGGYGDDYLDDVELFLRAYIAGFQNYRFNAIYSHHSRGARGGLNALGRGHKEKSRLDELYPQWIERSSDWLGFRLKKRR